MINTPLLTTMLAYSVLFASLLIPQKTENKQQYLKKLKIVSMGIVPTMVSVLTIKCLSMSCMRLATINSTIILLWCLSCVFINMFKKLI